MATVIHQYSEELLSNTEKNYTIKVEIYSEQAIDKAELKYSYPVIASNWNPIYDLKINSNTNDNQIDHQANHYQLSYEK